MPSSSSELPSAQQNGATSSSSASPTQSTGQPSQTPTDSQSQSVSHSSSPAESASGARRRISSTGRLLNRFFRRLIPNLPPSSSSSSSHKTQSEGTTTTNTDTTKCQAAREEGEEATQDQPPESTEEANMAAMKAPNWAQKENVAPGATADLNKIYEPTTSKPSVEEPASPLKVVDPSTLKLTADGLRRQQSDKAASIHQGFIDQALDMARLALRTNETPVGCVLVHENTVIAKGMNATNVTRNGTRHAEFMALSALLSQRPEGVPTDYSHAEPRHIPTVMSAEEAAQREREKDAQLGPNPSLNDPDHVKKGHLYPYGQKLLTERCVPRSIVSECTLYVTVEPCVMCASLLRQFGIRKVYFGAVNDKFGGAGGVFSIHLNSLRPEEWKRKMSEENKPQGILVNGQPSSRRSGSSSSHGERPPQKSTNGQYHQPLSNPDGDGGNVERGFEIEGGWGRDEAVGLLRRFYVQENGRAPQPRKKEGRAARLAAMEQGVAIETPPGENGETSGGDLITGGTPKETGAGDATAEADKTAIEAEIEEIPVQDASTNESAKGGGPSE